MNHDRDKSLLLQIREARRHEYKDEVRKELIAVDDLIIGALEEFEQTFSSDALTKLVSAWSRAIYLLGLAMGPADPSSSGAKMRATA